MIVRRVLLIDGEGVTVAFHYRHWIPRLFRFGGFTWGRTVRVRWAPADDRHVVYETAIAHECIHVAQWRRLGWRFLPRYLGQLLRHGYRRNAFEVEARAWAGPICRAQHPRVRAPWLEAAK